MSPSYVAVRLQDSCCCISTEFQLVGEEEKDCAGLAIFQDNKNHIRFEYYGQEKSIRLIVCCKEKEEIVKETKDVVEAFQIVINGLKADFLWRKERGWTSFVSNVDIRFLSTESAGGFTGCTVGMYASSNGEKSQGYARFEKFIYT